MGEFCKDENDFIGIFSFSVIKIFFHVFGISDGYNNIAEIIRPFSDRKQK